MIALTITIQHLLIHFFRKYASNVLVPRTHLVSGVKLKTFLIRCQAAWYLASKAPSTMGLIITYLNNRRSIVLAVKIMLTCNNLKLTGNYIDFSQSWLKFGVDLLCIHSETDLNLAHIAAPLGRFPAKSSTSYPRGSSGFSYSSPAPAELPD